MSKFKYLMANRSRCSLFCGLNSERHTRKLRFRLDRRRTAHTAISTIRLMSARLMATMGRSGFPAGSSSAQDHGSTARPISGVTSIIIMIAMMAGTASIRRAASISMRITTRARRAFQRQRNARRARPLQSWRNSTNMAARTNTGPTDPTDLNNAQDRRKIRAWAFLCLLRRLPVRVRTSDGIHLGTDLGE